MDFMHLDTSVANYERLKRDLRDLEAEEETLKKQLSRIEGKKQNILDQLKDFDDDHYEESMLHMVYEQRRSKH